MRKMNPPQMLALSFLCAILAGAGILSLPAATAGPGRIPFIDSLFTSTSAVCVTGLIVADTGTTFSALGTWVILALFQIGGLGIMTFSMLFAVLMGRKIGFSETDVIRSSVDKHSVIGLEKLIKYIVVIALSVELVGAGLLFLRWSSVTSWPLAEVLRQSVFHAVSGFCNAGFSLFSDSLKAFRGDPVINLVMMGLIVIGGIGFVVIMDVAGLFSKKGRTRRLSLQSRIVVLTSAALIAAGAALIFFFEKNNSLAAMGPGERLLTSVFQSVTARTAGFNTIRISLMSAPSQLVLIFLMFIGASPGSTGGGIKTCTFAVLAATICAIVRNRERTEIFGRSVPAQVIKEVLVIVFLAIMWIFAATLVLAYVERNNPLIAGNLINALFEVVSAFGTVGLSTGVTEGLSFAGKVCVIMTMYVGRIGPLTMALAIASRERPDRYVYPEENVMVG